VRFSAETPPPHAGDALLVPLSRADRVRALLARGYAGDAVVPGEGGVQLRLTAPARGR
jgi:hypothetical protein